MDVQSTIASLGYAQSRPATQPKPEGAGGAGGALGSLVGSFEETLKAGENTAKQAMLGRADPQALVQALASSELAVETAVTLRDKVVEAYQEILRMQV